MDTVSSLCQDIFLIVLNLWLFCDEVFIYFRTDEQESTGKRSARKKNKKSSSVVGTCFFMLRLYVYCYCMYYSELIC